jgi:ATP-dependent DNA helicase RecG
MKIGYFASETDLRYQDEVGGDVFSQPGKALELILTKYLRAGISYQGIRRIERFPMPPSALREALLNAAIHRDYATPAPIQIRVYPDRLRIWNPGQLPEGWTMERLLGAHSSQPHNPEIAHVFFRAGEIEAWGRGIQRAFEACREAGTPEPRIEFDGRDVWVEFPFSEAYLEQAAVAAGGITPEITGEVAPEVTPEVTPEVGRLLLAFEGEMSRSELMNALGLRDEKHFRESYLQVGLAAGAVEMTRPDKPQSRFQKYRLTSLGSAIRARSKSDGPK